MYVQPRNIINIYFLTETNYPVFNVNHLEGPELLERHTRSFPHPLRGLIPPNFRTTPPASYLDKPPNISPGVLNIIITLAKYEQYLVYVMLIVDSNRCYLFIEFCIKIRKYSA